MDTVPYIRPFVLNGKKYDLLKAIDKGKKLDPMLGEEDFKEESAYVAPGGKWEIRKSKEHGWIYLGVTEEGNVDVMREITFDETVEIKQAPRVTRKTKKIRVIRLPNGKRYNLDQAVLKAPNSLPLDKSIFTKLIYKEENSVWNVWKINTGEYVYREYDLSKQHRLERTKILNFTQDLEVEKEEERPYEGEGEEPDELTKIQEEMKKAFVVNTSDGSVVTPETVNVDQIT